MYHRMVFIGRPERGPTLKWRSAYKPCRQNTSIHPITSPRRAEHDPERDAHLFPPRRHARELSLDEVEVVLHDGEIRAGLIGLTEGEAGIFRACPECSPKIVDGVVTVNKLRRAQAVSQLASASAISLRRRARIR